MKLDEHQYRAVNTDSDNVIVVASAGSGKTRVLTSRVEKLMMDGVHPSSIVCITFTNMAASEMRERLSHLPGVSDAFIGTIHSFANRIYSESGRYYRIRSTEVEMDLFREVLPNSRGWTGIGGIVEFTYERYLVYLENKKKLDNGYISREYLMSTMTSRELSELKLSTKYVNRLCKQRSILSFDELILKTERYFSQLSTSLDYLLVDEFQDVGRNEAKFLKGLSAKSNFFVGDPRQAIYGFKGGDDSILLDLMESGDFEVHYLNNNYRSTHPTVNESTKVIDQIVDYMSNKVTVFNPNPGKVIYDSKLNLSRYLSEITDEYGKWFILARTRKDVNEISRLLDTMGIPNNTFQRRGMDHIQMNELLQSNEIKVLTVHVSKGLESDNVILYGDFPLKVPSYRRNDEERKVMYVGMTRARENLVVLS